MEYILLISEKIKNKLALVKCKTTKTYNPKTFLAWLPNLMNYNPKFKSYNLLLKVTIIKISY